MNNFPISGLPPQTDYLWGMVVVKKAAALANMDTGRLDKEVGEAIVAAADEVLSGQHDRHFVVDPWQAGAGTSHNMNVNEVLGNRATQILAAEGKERQVHPNDDVNMAQSSNDTNPTAVRLGALRATPLLLDALARLEDALSEESRGVRPCPEGCPHAHARRGPDPFGSGIFRLRGGDRESRWIASGRLPERSRSSTWAPPPPEPESMLSPGMWRA